MHLLAGARHRLLPLPLAAWTPLSRLPLAAWRRVGGELTPSFPCGRACKCKDSFSAYYLSDSGFWCLPPSSCVCVCVCVYVGGRKEIKRERVREGEASSVSSPPFSLPVSLLPVTPSFLPSPGPPSSPASSQTETPLTTQTTPGPFDSPHFSVPPTKTTEQVRLGLFQPCAEAFKKYFLPSPPPPPLLLLLLVLLLLFSLHSLVSVPSCLSVSPVCTFQSFPCSTCVPSQKKWHSCGRWYQRGHWIFSLPPLIFYPDISSPPPTMQSLHLVVFCILTPSGSQHVRIQYESETKSFFKFIFKSAWSVSWQGQHAVICLRKMRL